MRLAVAAPDGYGKSTLLSYALVLWSLAYRRHQCIAIGSGSRMAAGELLRAVETEIRENRRLVADFPHLARISRSSGASGSRASPPRDMYVGGIARVGTFGPGGTPADLVFEGRPPELVIMDGFEKTVDDGPFEPGRSAGEPCRAERFLRSRILSRLTEASVVVTGSLIHAHGLIDRLLEPGEYQSWTKRLYPAIISYPAHFDKWFKWAEIRATNQDEANRFLDENRGCLQAGASVLWPERESLERLMILRAEHGWAWFDRYRQCRPIGGSLARGGAEVSISIGDDPEAGIVRDDAGFTRHVPQSTGPRVQIATDSGHHRGPECVLQGDETAF